MLLLIVRLKYMKNIVWCYWLSVWNIWKILYAAQLLKCPLLLLPVCIYWNYGKCKVRVKIVLRNQLGINIYIYMHVVSVHSLSRTIEYNVCTQVTNCSSTHERVILVFISPSNTQVSTKTVHHKSTYIILFLTWHNESINDDKSNDPYTSYPCLTQSLGFHSFDDVTMDWWWHHNDQTIVMRSCEQWYLTH